MEASQKLPSLFTVCLLMQLSCLLLLRVCLVDSREFTLGFLVPYSKCQHVGNSYHCGKMYASAITVALEKINSDPHLLSGHNITYIWSDTQCDQTKAVKQQLKQLREGVDAFIGPGCDCDTAAVVAEAAEKTMISYECTSFRTKKLARPRTFLRTIGSVDEDLTSSILSLLERFNWTKVGIVYENRGKYIRLKEHLLRNLRETSTINYKGIVKELPRDFFKINEAFVNESFRNVKRESKVLIFVTTVWVSRPTIFWLRKLRLVPSDTVFIICETNPIELLHFNTVSNGFHKLLTDYSEVGSDGNLRGESTKRLLRHLDSVFMIAARSPRGREYETFTSEVKDRIKEAPFFSKKYDIYKDAPPPIQAASLYDAVNLYAIGLNMTLAQGKTPTGVNIAENIKSLGKFNSIRGFNMVLDKQGSARYDLTLYQIKNTENINEVLRPVGTFVLSSSEDASTTSSKLVLSGKEHITLPGGPKEHTAEEPKWMRSTKTPTTRAPEIRIATDENFNKLTVVITVVMCALVLLVLFLVFTRYYRLKKELKNQLWKTRYDGLGFRFKHDLRTSQLEIHQPLETPSQNE